MWVLTVSWLTTSFAAMPLLECPADQRRAPRTPAGSARGSPRARTPRRRSGRRTGHPSGQGRVDDDVALVDPAQVVHELVGVDPLEDVAARPGPEGLEEVVLVVVDGQHARPWSPGGCAARSATRSRPLSRPMPDVAEHDVGLRARPRPARRRRATSPSRRSSPPRRSGTASRSARAAPSRGRRRGRGGAASDRHAAHPRSSRSQVRRSRGHTGHPPVHPRGGDRAGGGRSAGGLVDPPPAPTERPFMPDPPAHRPVRAPRRLRRDSARRSPRSATPASTGSSGTSWTASSCPTSPWDRTSSRRPGRTARVGFEAHLMVVEPDRLLGALRRRRLRAGHRARGGVHPPAPHPRADPRARAPGRGRAQPAHAGEHGRTRARGDRPDPRDDGQPRVRRPGLHRRRRAQGGRSCGP